MQTIPDSSRSGSDPIRSRSRSLHQSILHCNASAPLAAAVSTPSAGKRWISRRSRFWRLNAIDPAAGSKIFFADELPPPCDQIRSAAASSLRNRREYSNLPASGALRGFDFFHSCSAKSCNRQFLQASNPNLRAESVPLAGSEVAIAQIPSDRLESPGTPIEIRPLLPRHVAVSDLRRDVENALQWERVKSRVSRFKDRSRGRPNIKRIVKLVNPAFAQTGGAGFGLANILPLVLIFVIMYFLLIRPQQKKAKAHREMVANLRRGDQIVTQGGVIGKIAKVKDDNEVEVEIAENIRIRVVRSTISQVVSKTEPAS